ncbi:MAG: lipoyl synthase [DPANN group archaeon]|nr:lipoyl synthase [DPANN group archaeon]
METKSRKPSWLKIRPSTDRDFSIIKNALRRRGLVSVCEEARCPNMAECWKEQETATFMVMGDTCTRGCKFCAIRTARIGRPLDPKEPEKLADAIAEMNLHYAVITSVDRDDLPDQGAGHFAACIRAIRKARPDTHIEALIPDFRGERERLREIIKARPDVIAHNVETVPRLQQDVRDPRASYAQSLNVLRTIKELDPTIRSKTSLMLGLGETAEEVASVMKDLREAGCDILTLGQYLRPGNRFLEVKEYVHPEQFERYRKQGETLGFLYVASGPLVRSSYRAGELFREHLLGESGQETGQPLLDRPSEERTAPTTAGEVIPSPET